MKENKNKSKEKLIVAILYTACTVAFCILAVRDIVSQEGIPSLLHIGLVIAFGGLAVDNYMKYIKNKKKLQKN